ncbi:HVO_A0114 family putative DNA-binding protein [Dissulfurispira sp.]|uniref:HVO_A0114 family putative DNA-binding protein n=1 Tax=Dissulfurispira sp. TaxID=2817609 RepID=UPI002FDA70D6
MKVKNVTVGIKSIEEVLKDAKEVMKKLERGEKVKKRKSGIYFESLEVMRKAITTERVRILKIIKEKHPDSIYELAKLLGRNLKNVSDDVHYLAELGLIELGKGKSNGREKIIPFVGYDKILLEIPV